METGGTESNERADACISGGTFAIGRRQADRVGQTLYSGWDNWARYVRISYDAT
jgi:hypothetical protein